MNAREAQDLRPTAGPAALLDVERLSVAIRMPGRSVEAVRGVSFRLRRGETLGIVGESGSGKTLTALAVLRLLPHAASVSEGRVLFEGEDLRTLGTRRLRELRRHRLGYIPQDPHTALHPSFRIRRQILEGLARTRAERREIEARAIKILTAMGLPDVETALDCYPHELSGGMKQRIVTAIALVREPSLIVADEPTSALDVTVQAQLVGHLKELTAESGVSMLFISHDLGVVNSICDTIAVMYGGEIVEYGPAVRVTKSPAHPYTQGLLASLPSIADNDQEAKSIPGRPVQPGEDVAGCRFAARCAQADDRCRREAPHVAPAPRGEGWAACWRMAGA